VTHFALGVNIRLKIVIRIYNRYRRRKQPTKYGNASTAGLDEYAYSGAQSDGTRVLTLKLLMIKGE
jgi:hypothetical protein